MRSAALRLCLLLLLLLFANFHLGSAAALKKRANKSDLLEPDPYTKKCPMGTYLANDPLRCIRCKEDEYTEYPNDFPKCLGCRTCREDQVEVSPCITTRNTQCACKNGTFCLPDHPCEMCQKCQTRCPKGQVMIAPCTQHSDLQCGPPLEPSSSFSTGIIVITVMLPVGLGLLLVCFWRCCRNHHGAGAGGERSRKPSIVVDRLLRRLWIRDNIRNEQIDQIQQRQPLSTGQGSEVPHDVGLEEVARRTSDPNVEAWKKLVPVPGKDPISCLHHSFRIFVKYVPFPDWKRFGRALDLTENELYLAEQNDRASQEPFFQMLNTWLHKQGSNASVHTLLETLLRIDLNGVAEKVASELVKEEYFEYEVS
ncbi:tumor necrosis factor receptor superfamily member 10A-like isoform X2 [Numida meleagris]|uniref:tumor necrosis factor receptor superfamily member 10A-like isoform X2 n=1 Tax=Numida meleagris TaxID=8996 RepID=UPI000B3E0BDD|nr:tumor necrosis factor receptor superfamily member 10A-like isoform X2 [Numida meleagris]